MKLGFGRIKKQSLLNIFSNTLKKKLEVLLQLIKSMVLENLSKIMMSPLKMLDMKKEISSSLK